MMAFHFLRPGWLLALIPLALLTGLLWRKQSALLAWHDVCDAHLLVQLTKAQGQSKRHASLLLLCGSALFMILSLSGPTWSQYPIPTYKQVLPRVVVLDMSDAMRERDLTPDRLTRAKFKLHDLFNRKGAGQFGLIVYTGEPFTVSPLTDDAQTIDSLLSSLSPDIMPVEGQQLEPALVEAGKLIKQAGFSDGEILVLTPDAPDEQAVAEAKRLAANGIQTSIMPIHQGVSNSALFSRFASAGQGAVIPFSDTATDLDAWLSPALSHHHYEAAAQDEFPLWRDQGRWFLIPALMLLLPAYRRGWLQRIQT